jgi:hypothetical protein
VHVAAAVRLLYGLHRAVAGVSVPQQHLQPGRGECSSMPKRYDKKMSGKGCCWRQCPTAAPAASGECNQHDVSRRCQARVVAGVSVPQQHLQPGESRAAACQHVRQGLSLASVFHSSTCSQWRMQSA